MYLVSRKIQAEKLVEVPRRVPSGYIVPSFDREPEEGARLRSVFALELHNWRLEDIGESNSACKFPQFVSSVARLSYFFRTDKRVNYFQLVSSSGQELC